MEKEREMGVSKKIRFEVFKRDGFQCGYCGRTPPDVTLEADHINPKALGGIDDINNLLTSCFDCNRGKSKIPLDKAPARLKDNLETLKEKEDQLREYTKIIVQIERRLSKEADEIEEIYTSYFEIWVLSDKFKTVSLKRFLKLLPKQEVADAMHLACTKKVDEYGGEDAAISYFCGICWKKIKGVKHGESTA